MSQVAIVRDGIELRKSSASGGGNDCVYLAPVHGVLFDSKAEDRLPGRPSLTGLVKLARTI